MAEHKGWIVMTSSERPIREIASDLTKAGFSVVHVLEEIGSITGAAADDVITKLRSIRGVVDISPDRSISIGPPDSGENW
jgi:predicted transcriptional regulator